jgi:hypothetical protein
MKRNEILVRVRKASIPRLPKAVIENIGYVQKVVGFPRFLAQSSVLSATGQG